MKTQNPKLIQEAIDIIFDSGSVEYADKKCVEYHEEAVKYLELYESVINEKIQECDEKVEGLNAIRQIKDLTRFLSVNRVV